MNFHPKLFSLVSNGRFGSHGQLAVHPVGWDHVGDCEVAFEKGNFLPIVQKTELLLKNAIPE